jgi:hypothetical protein
MANLSPKLAMFTSTGGRGSTPDTVPAFQVSVAPRTANIGWLGLQHVLENGGSGYFPKRIVLPHLTAKRLTPIGGAPEFSMPAYVVYPLECDRDLFGRARGHVSGAINHRPCR